MKLLTKNGLKYAVGMFWQIPDHGKKTINFSKLNKDTGYNRYCQIGKYDPTNKNFKLTYGFCNKDGLQNEKKVSALGKFIVEASNLTAEYANSIICYKFKSAGDLDDDGKYLAEDMFGYIVLLNGTICPDEGEYVAQFDSVRQSIIDKAHLYPIDTLYLPADIAPRFLNIYERLDNALYDDELLLYVLHSASADELKDLTKFISERYIDSKFAGIVSELLQYAHVDKSGQFDASALKMTDIRLIVQHELFHNKIKDNMVIDNNIRYLIANIVQIPLSSDAIYWQNSKFKYNYNKSLIKSIFSQTSKKYKIVFICAVSAMFSYIFYGLTTGEELQLIKQSHPKQLLPKAVALSSPQLINLCLTHNDQFFRDLNHWTFIGLKCNSLGGSFMFNSDVDTTLSAFIRLIGESTGISLHAKNGVYNQKFKIMKTQSQISNFTKTQVINNLQQSAIDYQFKLTLPTMVNHTSIGITKYIINSTVSPVFLLNHGVLDGCKMNSISMTYDKNSGIYNWTIQGEFK